MKFNIIQFIIICIFSSIISEPIVLEPIYQEGENIGIIIIQGAFIGKEQYIPLAQKIQQSLIGIRAWISITDDYFELPISFIGTIAINNCKESLSSRGLKTTDRYYLVGHSLGGIAALSYYENNKEISGVILLGCVPERNQRDKTKDLNLLIIGGELDGLSRITRTTEEFYHRCLDSNKKKVMTFKLNKQNNKELEFLENEEEFTSVAVILLKGCNHMSFANGEPSSFVKTRDLKSEIGLEEGHTHISNLVFKFVCNSKSLQQDINNTYDLIKPIIKGFELEGSIHFNRPDQSNCHRGYCSIGSDWVKIAQEILSDKELLSSKGVSLNITNDYVILSSLPPLGDLFHPKINFDDDKKIYSIKTYSQCSWQMFDKMIDGGFAPISASEIGSKMSSRQCSYVYAAGFKKEDVPLSIDSDGNICSQINKKAYEWAIENSNSDTVERYKKYGQNLNFVNDKLYSNGFSWTYNVLNWNENNNTGDMDIMSYIMVTSIDAKPLPIFAPDGLDCYHYCKLLSPARAIEWIYVDGLRKNYNTGNK